MANKVEKYKVIGIDNYGRETIADVLIAENMDKENAEKLRELLNGEHNGSDIAPYWCQVVVQSYRLSRGMEDLI